MKTVKLPLPPFHIFMAAWIIFSIGYVSYDQWNDFKVNYAQKSYITGKAETVQSLITQALNKECKPFDAYIEDNKVTLINTACLQPASEESSVESVQ
ncbi:hypothetical protein HON22_02260 [Candidatus Peregrinibacteria bacterium]|jgi:hypothetical protein|nr:hypothetical protein [Candidatus Peregrinibacteria bacterium]